MTSQRTLAAALLAALATLASLAGTTAPAAAAPPTPPTGEEAAWAEELLALLDEDRRAMGLRSLEASPQMGAVAHAWSRHQAAETRMHANPDYREQIPAGHTAAAEALAWGQRSPRSMYTVLSQAAGPR